MLCLKRGREKERKRETAGISVGALLLVIHSVHDHLTNIAKLMRFLWHRIKLVVL